MLLVLNCWLVATVRILHSSFSQKKSICHVLEGEREGGGEDVFSSSSHKSYLRKVNRSEAVSRLESLFKTRPSAFMFMIVPSLRFVSAF